MRMLVLSLISVIVAVSCAKAPVDRTSLESAQKGLGQLLVGERIDPAGLFYNSAVYFNGSCNTGTALLESLKKDHRDATELLVNKTHRGMQDSQQIVVYTVKNKGKADSHLISAWLKVRGSWTVLFIAKGDGASSGDAASLMKSYETTFNAHKVSDLMEQFYDKDICFIKGTNAVNGYDNVAKGLAFIESNFPYQHEFASLEQYALGTEYRITVGEITEVGKSNVRFKTIYVWRNTPTGPRLVVNFDYV